jgi:hypothetical protein
VGLFRDVKIGEIRNLGLVDAVVVGDGAGTGSLVGCLDGGAVLDCWVTAADVSGNVRVGGLVGDAAGAVARCSSRGRVSGVRYVGGLVGRLGDGRVNECYSKAQVSGTDTVGGLVGTTHNEASIVSACYATGRVDGRDYTGGLVGAVGQGRVHKCYAAGPVTGDQRTGGLVGGGFALADVIASFWDTETSGQTTSSGGMGRTTAEMRARETFSGWSFDLIWAICEGLNSPVLLWQIPRADLGCPDGVHATDFAWFAMEWNRQDCSGANFGCNWADFDDSGAVGFSDLAILAESWLVGVD